MVIMPMHNSNNSPMHANHKKASFLINPPPDTFHWGNWYAKNPIDGFWVSLDIVIMHAAWSMVDDSPSNHQAILVNTTLHTTIGEPHLYIVWPPGCCLNCYLCLLTDHNKHPQTWTKAATSLYTSLHTHNTSPHLKSTMEPLTRWNVRAWPTQCCWYKAGTVQYSPPVNACGKRKNFNPKVIRYAPTLSTAWQSDNFQMVMTMQAMRCTGKNNSNNGGAAQNTAMTIK